MDTNIDVPAPAQDTCPLYLNRYAALFNLIATIPSDNRFNINAWAKPENTECGTAACAAGHAALHPYFRAQGLDLKDESPELSGPHEWIVFNHHAPSDTYGLKSFWGYDKDRAGGLNYYHPFWPNTYAHHHPRAPIEATPEVVAEFIREWMERFWSAELVEQAIRETQGVRYNVEFVHKFAPWATKKTRIKDVKPGKFFIYEYGGLRSYYLKLQADNILIRECSFPDTTVLRLKPSALKAGTFAADTDRVAFFSVGGNEAEEVFDTFEELLNHVATE